MRILNAVHGEGDATCESLPESEAPPCVQGEPLPSVSWGLRNLGSSLVPVCVWSLPLTHKRFSDASRDSENPAQF